MTGLPLLKIYKQYYKMIPTKELFEYYEAYATEYRHKPLPRKGFVNQLEATAIFTQKDGSQGKFLYFKDEELKGKLKDMGLYDDTIFLD